MKALINFPKYWLFILLAVSILTACGTLPQQKENRELLWNRVLVIYISEAKAGNVSKDQAKKAIVAIKLFKQARNDFEISPGLSACTMAKSVSSIADIIGKPLAFDIAEFCINPLDDLTIEAITKEIDVSLEAIPDGS